MNAIETARCGLRCRALLVHRVLTEGWPVAEAALAAGVAERTAYRWLARFRNEGDAGLRDRSSRPHRSPRQFSQRTERRIIKLRCQRISGLHIARRLKVSRSAVSRVLRRYRLSRARNLEPRPTVRRYERHAPGELLHIDTKKLGRIEGGPGHRIHGDRRRRSRGVGWEYAHVCIDDHSRLAYVEVQPDEKKETVCAFFERARAWFASQGVPVIERIMTDNGGAYRSKRFAALLGAHACRHIFTRPYTPKTNGKAERFIQSLAREWAYAQPFQCSARRADDLPRWLKYYNNTRPHHGIGGNPPVSRLQSPTT